MTTEASRETSIYRNFYTEVNYYHGCDAQFTDDSACYRQPIVRLTFLVKHLIFCPVEPSSEYTLAFYLLAAKYCNFGT